ncbi:MAG: CfrBI family restriction endonuclease, partial [Anaerolineales bacterium]|nr:CfrBI family restriction endonuclease [Anaerolineales bacterium]
LTKLFVEVESNSIGGIKALLVDTAERLGSKKLQTQEKRIAQWLLGLTEKAFQNVLRDDSSSIAEYAKNYIKACAETVEKFESEIGYFKGSLNIGEQVSAQLDWLSIAFLLNTTGAQTLTTRGSEKSAYGKLFEKLVLGALLHSLGFKFVTDVPDNPKGIFWLSSPKEKRESDATLLVKAGMGVRFDIGFIGRGNPEITLDKVTRFENELSIGTSKWYMATFIVVDRVGEGSKVVEIAESIQGVVVQMSGAYWPKQVAIELGKRMNFKHPIQTMNDGEVYEHLVSSISSAPFKEFLDYV